MYKPLFQHLWIIGVFLCCEPHQSFTKKKDLEGFKTCYNDINSQVILVPIDQVWICDVLTHNITTFFGNLGFWPNHFDALAAAASRWFHDVHMLII